VPVGHTRAVAAPDPTLPSADDRALRDARRARYREAAYDAERQTGDRERTDDQTRRNVVARVAIIVAGSIVTLGGLGMLVLPGPGIVVVVAGLGILATEVSWAERLLAYAKRKARLDQVTAQRPWIKPVSIAVTALAVAVSVLYAVRWR